MKRKEIKPEDIWNTDTMNRVNEFIKEHSEEQSKERKIRNQFLSIQYKIEEYIDKEDTKEDEILNILDFVKMYLDVLNITKKELAQYFEMEDSNLHKYLIGKRKLNAKVALKISSFSRTKPEYWFRIQIKNDLFKLNKEEINDYEKYDYEKLLFS